MNGRISLVLFAASLSLVACRSYPRLPDTEKSAAMIDLNQAMPGTAPPVAARVTFERIRNARSEPQNWLTYYGAYDGQRFSSLDQINTSNVKRLRPAWNFQVGVTGIIPATATYSWEAAPIVVDGVMFVSAWDGYLFALDAVTGQPLWQYQHMIPLDTPLCCGNVNRGVAVANGKVFLATQNGNLLALDASNGKLLWRQTYADVRAGESATMAPLVVKDMVIAGSSGGEFGVRGHLDAFDLETGAPRWRRYTIPKPGEPGSETWPDNDSWERGGGTTWITGTYDPELDLVYWGTGNPGPLFDDTKRRGDNLYTNSVLALDPDDGSLRWHYQYTPDDTWDYDGVNENILFEQHGRKLLGHFDRNGHFFVLDRTNGKLVRVTPFSETTWGSIDSAGQVKPNLRPSKEGTVICPGPAGAKEWTHAAYNPKTGLFYVPVIDACANFRVVPTEFREGMFYLGGDADVRVRDQMGQLKAIDPETGRTVWTWQGKQPMVASVLTTGGDLVLTGEPNGMFNAWHARTGELLWQYQTGNGIHSNPVTYSVNGRQYIAVPTGWGGWLEGFAPEMLGATRGSSLYVFALTD